MANVVITIKIMPESPEEDLKLIEKKALEYIIGFAGKGDTKIEEEPIAFGLKAIKIFFIMDEKIGSTEKLEDKIKTISGVQSVEVTDVRRAIG